MTDRVEVKDRDAASLLARHDLSPGIIHTNLQRELCVCRPGVVAARPISTGNSCADCGGMTVQTGTCSTCTSCGTSGGCG